MILFLLCLFISLVNAEVHNCTKTLFIGEYEFNLTKPVNTTLGAKSCGQYTRVDKVPDDRDEILNLKCIGVAQNFYWVIETSKKNILYDR